MPNKSFPLEHGSNRTVDIAWKGMWKGFTVSSEGETLGTMNGQKELQAGGRYTLSDGSRLEVKLHKSAMGAELQLLRDGVPLPGSASDPQARVKSAAGITFFIAGLNIVLGIVALAFNVQFLLNLGLGLFSIFFGAVFLGLGFAIRKASVVALIIAIALFAVDSIASVVFTIDAGGRPPMGGIVFRVFLLLPLIRAVSAAKAVQKMPTRLDDTAGGGAHGSPVSVPVAPSKDP